MHRALIPTWRGRGSCDPSLSEGLEPRLYACSVGGGEFERGVHAPKGCVAPSQHAAQAAALLHATAASTAALATPSLRRPLHRVLRCSWSWRWAHRRPPVHSARCVSASLLRPFLRARSPAQSSLRVGSYALSCVRDKPTSRGTTATRRSAPHSVKKHREVLTPPAKP